MEAEGGGKAEPLLIRQFMALLFNKAIQGGEAQWRRCSRGSIALNPRLVCMGTTYLLRGPVELSVGLCVLHRPPLCLLRGPSPTFPQRPREWTERPVAISRFHPFTFAGVPKPPPALTCKYNSVFTHFTKSNNTAAANREHSRRFHMKYLSARRAS